MWPTTTRNVTATPPPFPAWWLGFYNPGSYVYQHFRESVRDLPKSPEVATSHCTLSQQDWKSLIQGLASACLRGLCGKNGLFLDPPYPPCFHAHPRIYIKSPHLGTTFTRLISLSKVLFLFLFYAPWFLSSLSLSPWKPPSVSAEDIANISGCFNEKKKLSRLTVCFYLKL